MVNVLKNILHEKLFTQKTTYISERFDKNFDKFPNLKVEAQVKQPGKKKFQCIVNARKRIRYRKK